MILQSSNYVNKATPLLIQCEGGLEVGVFIQRTKLVECPVVDNSPLLADVL